ncbi:MAG: SMP-30/gluconolactonase/LRE family protein [Gemmataceae bacterium]|nr:SMP-30/gluconolactonase/LRE family protein [Gemmataceae bacterium]
MRSSHSRLLLALGCILLAAVRADAQALDPAQAKADPKEAILWYDVRGLGIEGQGWTEIKAPYDRLPAKAEGVVRAPVWNLSRHSAGLCVRFVTAAKAIHARWTLTSESLAMPHMPATGVSGLDLYVKDTDGKWRWLANGRPTKVSNQVVLASGIPEGKREYLLYLPLYNGVSSVEIGVTKDAALAKAEARSRKPILFYGTSITQGGCASRPGMVHTAILGRRLDYPVINLGFSGNGKMETEVAQLLAEVDPAAYVIDCLPNMSAAEVAERVEPLVHTLRKARPKTPIVLVEDRTFSHAFLLPALQQRHADSRAALKKAYDKLKNAGVEGLHYLPGDRLLGDDNEGTVDGSHPTDLGFVRQADAFQPVLAAALRADAKLIPKDAKLEKVAGGCKFTEGPAADADGNLFFTDSPRNYVMVLRPDNKLEVFDKDGRDANGMRFDAKGRLVACCGEGGARAVVRYEKDMKKTVLADKYNGKRLTAPNDLCFDRQGRIYFTDPCYGSRPKDGQEKYAVYRIEAEDGEPVVNKVTRVIDDVDTPNGIAISPDGKTLYVADNAGRKNGPHTLVAYDVSADGTCKRRAVLHDFKDRRGIDGMVVDTEGNIYATAESGKQSGVYIFSPTGEQLGFLHTPEEATNCTFGDKDLKTLYVTAGSSVYKVRLNATGYLAYPTPKP